MLLHHGGTTIGNWVCSGEFVHLHTDGYLCPEENAYKLF